MPIEVIKVVIVGIVAFSLGTIFVDGRQNLEISKLNNQISTLEQQLEQSKKQTANEQAKTKKQQQIVEEFNKKWQATK